MIFKLINFYSKTQLLQKIGASISNYRAYIKIAYKYINLKLIGANNNNSKYLILIILININKIIGENEASTS